MQERSLGQKFFVDLSLDYVNLRTPSTTDNVHDTIDYAAVYQHAPLSPPSALFSHILKLPA